MQEYALEIGLVIIALGTIRILRDLLVSRNSSVIKGTVSKVKNKTRKSSRYCYPKIIVNDESADIEMSFPSARKRGHDRYYEGEEISLYKYRNFLFKDTYKPLNGFWFSSFQILFYGIVVIIISQFI